jgi:hypothetical protein
MVEAIVIGEMGEVPVQITPVTLGTVAVGGKAH